MTTQHDQETKFVQIGNEKEQIAGAISTPIYMSTAYRHHALGESTGYDYTRTKNPTRTVLEEGIAQLEGGACGFACSSGMAAIQLVLSLLKAGDHIIVTTDIYGGTYRLFEHFEQHYQLSFTYVDCKVTEAVRDVIQSNTKAFFIETPTNPLLEEVDLKAISQLAKESNSLLIVDNTFYTPYLQQPISLGADLVIHSATKYLAGHNDVLAGLVVAKTKQLSEQLAVLHNNIGATLSPFDCWLVIRGMKTLPIRMRQQQDNAIKLVHYLGSHPKVKEVIYPGRGGMLSFRLENREAVETFLNNISLITFAESLGGVESFITYPLTQTHADIPESERIARGIDETLLRFSVGIETIADLTRDLSQSFKKIN
ncbi:cystathionine gamma-synthase [Amphibacillus marinus]|uniref:Cystathionine gamma-synthase n=1 Tax=Amphibacillus marinus TaxID=872970 RepID=A0A1H8QW40_9BACI|nr:methionine biosynthesis PLP-dependent protein [Amphibacillus marinus]SEO58201.1 cystathionine gamma-synthase [Amphibacillus marinus]